MIAGDGTQRAALEARVRELGIGGVEFVGRVPNTRMGALYDAADVYLNSPDIDNMPGSIIEAYAAGVPVVTTDAGGIPYIVRHEETGLLVEQNAPPEIAAAVARLVSDAALRERMVETARRRARERFTRAASARAFSELFAEQIGRREVPQAG